MYLNRNFKATLLIVLSLAIAFSTSLPAAQIEQKEENKGKQRHILVTSVAAAVAVVGCFALPVVKKICGDKIQHLLRSAENKPKTASNTTKPTTKTETTKSTTKIEKTKKSTAKVKETKAEINLPKRDYQKIVYQQEITDNIVSIVANTPISKEVDELLEVGNIQEIIWRLREENFSDQAMALEKFIAHKLETDEIVKIIEMDMGATKPQLIELRSGLRGVLKTSGYAKEVALFNLDKLIGTNVYPTTILRTVDGEQRSVQLFIENSWHAYKVATELAENGDNVSKHAPPMPKDIKTLRLLGGDWDANAGSWLYPAKGRTVAVDGGEAFKFNKTETEDKWRFFHKNKEDFLTSEEFVARLEAITAEQIREVVKPISSQWADNPKEIIDLREKLEVFAELDPSGNPFGLAIDMYDELYYLYQEAYRHLDIEAMKKKFYETRYYEYNTHIAMYLRNAIDEYIAAVRGTTKNKLDNNMLTTDEIRERLAREAKFNVKKEYRDLLMPLFEDKTWDKQKLKEIVDISKESASLQYDAIMNTEIDTLTMKRIQEIDDSSNYVPEADIVIKRLAKEASFMDIKMKKPLVWEVTSPHDNHKHIIFAGNSDLSLGLFPPKALDRLQQYFDTSDTVIRYWGINIRDEDYLSALSYLSRSEKLGSFFTELDMGKQVFAWTKAENKNIQNIDYNYKYFKNTLDDMDELELDFKFNRAYLNADKDSLQQLLEAKGYNAADLQQQNSAFAESFLARCGQGESCMIYTGVKNMLIDNDDVASLIKLLQDKGYTVTAQ